MKKQPGLTAQTEKKLIDAYFDLVARGKKVTVGAVAETAGYNRCTFYRYFPDTEELLSRVETEICGAFRAALESRCPLVPSDEITDALVAVHQKYGRYLSVLMGKYGDPRFVCRMKDIMEPIAMQLFSTGRDGNVAAELKAEFLLSAVPAVIAKWHDMNCPIPTSELAYRIREMLQHGVFEDGGI